MAPKRKSQGPSGVELTIMKDMKEMVESEVTLNRARETIVNDAFVDAFRCTLGSKAKAGTYTPYGLPLIDIMLTDEGRKVIDTAMQAVVSVTRKLNWTSASQNQRDLAAVAGHLMDTMGYPLEPEIRTLAHEHASSFRSGGSSSSSSLPHANSIPTDRPYLLQLLDDGRRYLLPG